MKLANLFIDRNFFLLLSSRFISQLGDKFFIPAVLWLAIAAEGGSATRLGIVSFVMVVPPFLSAFIGVYIDRVQKKRLMILCDILRFLLCLLLFANLLWAGSFWALVGVVFLIELIGQFFNIASQSFIPQLVKKENLLKANSYFAATENITSIIGYSAGGVIIALLGSAPLILWNGVSFFLSGLLLFGLSVEAYEKVTSSTNGEQRKINPFARFGEELMQGLKIAFLNRIIATILLVALVLNAATATLQMLITTWAHDILQLGSAGYGFLLTSLLVGTLVGSLTVNIPLVKKMSPQVLLSISTMMFGALFAVLPWFEHYLVSMSVFFVAGMFLSMTGISFSTIIMKNVDKENIGKLFGIIGTVTRGGQPLGVFLATSLLFTVSIHWMLFSVGAIVFVGGLYLLYVFVLTRRPESVPVE